MKGLGLDRNSPRFRRTINLAQTISESSDPINYAPRWFMDPLDGMPEKNVLVLSNPGDLTVPINNHLALVRAGGLLGDLRTDFEEVLERNEMLIDREVMLGYDRPYAPYNFPLYDIDDRDGNNCTHPSIEYPDFTCPVSPGIEGGKDYCQVCEPLGPFPVVETKTGKALVRFIYGKEHGFFGRPKSEEYLPYTFYSQNQAGEFLGHEGKVWETEWDCLITDADCPMNQ